MQGRAHDLVADRNDVSTETDAMALDSESAKKVIARIGNAFDELPAELKKAARYVTSNPNEVAFRSMRSVAIGAGVSPSTMVRLARAVGLDGFDDLRAAFQAQLAKGTRDADTASSGLRRIGTVGGDSLLGVKLVDLREASDSFFRDWMEV